MHDHNPTDDDATDGLPDSLTDEQKECARRLADWADGRTDADRADRTEHPTDPGTDHDATVVLMDADDGTPQAHYSNGAAGSWIKADTDALVDLGASR